MKQMPHVKFLLFPLILCTYSTLVGQIKCIPTEQTMPGPVHYMYVTPEGMVNCTDDKAFIQNAIRKYNNNIRLKDGDGSSNLAPPFNALESLSAATFSVTYTGFTAPAQAAFQRAVDIWSTLITTPLTIRVTANFSALGAGVLGSAGPHFLRGVSVSGVTSWYPDALCDKLIGADQGVGLSDIDASFSSSFANFYFGVDGVPQVGQIDFVSVVMHELGHGLGFLGSGRSGDAQAPCNSTAGIGCWGFVSGTQIPVIYDRRVQNGTNVSVINTATNANPSAGLHSFITTDNLFFAGTTVKAANGNVAAKLYAPTTYEAGSTYSHFDEITYPSANVNALMTPSIGSNEVQQSLGRLGCALFQDIGWTLAGACLTVLAIELADFSANNVGKTNVVKWITASERDNQLFKIQRSNDGKNFSTIGQLKGGGTTNTPQYYTFTDESPRQGINYYRLQHIESNGNTYFSKTVALNNLGKGAFWVQPTLVQNTINLVTSDATISDVSFSITDIIGRVVKTGVFPNNQTAMQLDIQELPVGQYFIGFQGHPTQRFVKQ